MSWLDAPASDTQITHRARLWLYVVSVLVLLFLVVPALIVIPMSFSASQYLEFPPSNWSLRWYEAYLSSPAWMQATATSFKAGVLTMLLATPLGTMAAYGMHMSGSRAAVLASAALLTPIIVPVILVGVALFYAYVQLRIVNSLLGLVLAHTILSLPIVIMIVASALSSFDLNQERVARSLGATRTQAFFKVVLPQIRFALVTALVLSFLTSFDEVIIAMFVSGGENSTLTRNMFTALRDQIDPTIAAISTVMIVVTSLLLAVVQFFGHSGRR